MVRITKGSKSHSHELPQSELASNQGEGGKGKDDQRQKNRQTWNQQEAEFVNPAANQISDEDDPCKDPESIEKSCIPKGKGHQDRHEDPEGWETDQVPQNTDHEGAHRNQNEDTEGLLKLVGKAKERPAIEKTA